jgi:hypothetical protein
LPVEREHFSKLINERRFAPNISAQKSALLRQLEGAYNKPSHKAPFFEDTLQLAGRCLECTDTNVAALLSHVLAECCRYLQIGTSIRLSSSLPRDAGASAEQRVIQVNQALGADHYVNAIGGTNLYDKESFRGQGIRLSFLKSRDITYPQFGDPFVPWLSILDVLMFNPLDSVRRMLGLYDLV